MGKWSAVTWASITLLLTHVKELTGTQKERRLSNEKAWVIRSIFVGVSCYAISLSPGNMWQDSLWKKQYHHLKQKHWLSVALVPCWVGLGCCWEETYNIYGMFDCQATTYLKGLTALLMNIISPCPALKIGLSPLHMTLSCPPSIPEMPDTSLSFIWSCGHYNHFNSLLLHKVMLNFHPPYNHATLSKENETQLNPESKTSSNTPKASHIMQEHASGWRKGCCQHHWRNSPNIKTSRISQPGFCFYDL